jgi:hypothetical protein
VEEILAGIWQGLLPVERVGRQDNFFELGGHSLLATRMIARIRSVFPVRVSIKLLFDSPTLQTFSLQVEDLCKVYLAEQITHSGKAPGELLNRVVSMPEG